MIGITVDQQTVEAGQPIIGSVFWSAERELAHLVISAEWEVGGEGARVHSITRQITWDSSTNSQRELTLPFRMLVPHEGPITYQGKRMTVSWRITARGSCRNALGHEEISEPFVVVARRVVRRQ